jgi:signal transduction histidine kinase
VTDRSADGHHGGHRGQRFSDLTPTAVRELLERQSDMLLLTVHELRRPLSLMGGHLAMIQGGDRGEPVAQDRMDAALVAMSGAVQDMAALIDEVAAVACQEDRPDVLRRQPCRLQRVVAAAIADVDLEAMARQVSVRQDGAQVAADVDPDRMRVAVVNLISNAVRHSPAGSVVAVTIGAKGSTVAIEVRDAGPGILAADAERVFDRWFRGSDQQVGDGLGLGLWIASRIAEWHGGRVTVRSAPGHGSTFAILLPWNRESLTAAR